VTALPDAPVTVRAETASDTLSLREGLPPTAARGAATATATRVGASRATVLTVVALAALTAFGAVVRAEGFSGLGFFRDDAWAALSAREGLGTAVHMWVTAPGYLFLQRAFMLVTPDTATWAQIPAFVAGVACIPAMYAVARRYGLGRVAGVVTAGIVSVSPIAAGSATRVKEYEADFLLSCLLLVLAESTRRRPGPRQVTALAAASVVAFLCSASVAPVVVAVWLTVAWSTLHRPPRPRHVAVGLGATAVGCGLVALAFDAHVSPRIQVFWGRYFVHHSSPHAFVTSVGSVTWHLLASLFGVTTLTGAARALVVLLCIALAIAGLYRNASMLAPALAVVVAYLAAVAHRVPLGTGRTDLYLYPALLLLFAAGATTLVRSFRAVTATASPALVRSVAVVGVTLAVLAGGVLVGRAVTNRHPYPGVDIRTLAAAIARDERPGDRIFVSELARYPWAEEVRTPFVLRFGEQWSTGFTVVSTDPNVFIAPSENYEGDSHPVAWAAAERGAHRLWYVWSPPLSHYNPSYAALRADGWRPVRTLHATGVSAALLVHR
jgi:hypothetical protein